MHDTAGTHRPGRLLIVAAIVLAALNLRPAMASLAPLIETIRVDLTLSSATTGLLTSIPVACLAVFPIAANRLAMRVGIERALLWALGLITVATAMRFAADRTVVLFASVLLVGFGVAAGQTYIPAIAKRHFGGKAAVFTALYAASMSASAVIVIAATPLLADLLGSWPAGLTVWAVPAVIAVALWLPIVRATPAVPASTAPQRNLPWQDPLAWRITSFSAAAFTFFFSILAWYAPAYQAQGWDEAAAGSLVSVLFIAQLVSTILMIAAAARRTDRRPLMAIGIVLGGGGLLAVALAPLAAPWLGAVATGFGLGILFALALTLPVDHGATPEDVARLTAMAMTVGYLFASAGPVAIGWLRDTSDGFALPLAALAVLIVVFTVPAVPLRAADRTPAQ